MRLAITCLISLAFAAPALAETQIRVENRSSVALVAISSFPYGRDGEIIDDNIGSMIDALAPGASTSFTISGDCGPVRLYVRLATTGDGDDLTLDLDTCTDRTVRLSD